MSTTKKYTDEERLELSKKLDAELDNFMDNLAKNQDKTDKKFNFDEWCKEIEKHPIFMKDLSPDENGEYSETVQALQALKYDTNEASTPRELREEAERFKEEGNKHFKFKKYRWAIDCYSSGIKLCCADRSLNSILYANRAASHKHLGNLRSALKDCIVARKLNPSNMKAILRGAECLLEMGYAKQCIDWNEYSHNAVVAAEKSENSVEHQKMVKDLRSFDELKARARRFLVKERRDERKRHNEYTAEIAKIKALFSAIQSRRIKLSGVPECDAEDEEALQEWYKSFEISILQYHKYPIAYYDAIADQLVWPVLLQYPAVGQLDMLTDCMESTPLNDLLHDVFKTPAEWDENHEYRAGNVRLFVPLDVFDEEQVCEVRVENCLREILTMPDVCVNRGLPVIQIYTKKGIEKRIECVDGYRFKFLK